MTARRPAGLPLRIAAIVAAVAALLSPALPARAAGIVFGTPTNQSSYGNFLDFAIDVTSPAAIVRAELRLRYPGSLGPYIMEVPVPSPSGSGTNRLQHRLDLAGGGLAPNTPIEVSWAVYGAGDADPTLSASSRVLYADTSHEWRTLEGEIVRVHWYEGDRAFAAKALTIGEDAVRETSALLGVTETEPLDFFIYGDAASFRAAIGPGAREWAGGTLDEATRTLFGLIPSGSIDDPEIGRIVTHELVHMVFHTAVYNPYRSPPFWFNEGLAVYLSQGYDAYDRSLVEAAARTGDLLPFLAVSGSFPTDATRARLAYAEAASAIDHLVRTYDRDRLFALVTSYRDGLTDDEAFTRAFGMDLAGFQAGWLAELGAREPTRYGPQPAPAGPVPPGWSGQAPGAVSTPAPGSTPGGAVSSPQASAGPGGDGPAQDGLGTAAVLGAIIAVAGVILVALVLARRRSVEA